MIPSLSYIVAQYSAPVFSGILAGLFSKAYFASKKQNTLEDCQNDLMKCREKVFELEALNEKLKNRLKEMEGYFATDRIMMN